MALQTPLVLISGAFSTLPPGDTIGPATDPTAQASGNAALVLAGTALASGNAGLVSASNKVPISGGYMTGQLFAASGVVVSGTLSRNGFNVVTVGDVETVTSTMIASGTIIDADVNISGAINATKLNFLQAGASGVARTVDSKLKDMVSVKDFGAVGDGVANDTVAIQAAIDASNYVYFPEGYYKITASLNISKNITLLGSGPTFDGTRITQFTAGQDIFSSISAGNTYFNISGFVLTGARYGIRFLDGYPQKASTIFNCAIYSCTVGINLESTLPLVGSVFINASVVNVIIEGCGTGIDSRGYAMVNGSSFRDIRILSCDYGVYLEETNLGSITSAVELANFTLENINYYGMILKGICAVISNLYTEQVGELSDVPDIALGGTGNPVTRICLIHPYFGPLGAARTGNTRIRFDGSSCSLDLISNQASGSLSINGDSFNSASFINLFGIANNQWSVINFNGAETRWPNSFINNSSITFPATQVSSADPNTLDDYEEGTWTPNQGAGLTVVGAFSSSGTYTKIGRQITITGTVAGATSVAISAGGTICTNCPFVGSGNYAGSIFDAATGLTGSQVWQQTSTVYAIAAAAAATSHVFTVTYFV